MNATQLNRPQPLEPQELLALESLVATAATTLATTFTPLQQVSSVFQRCVQ
jgi:hypothetical protein